jgi:hypothetical protein
MITTCETPSDLTPDAEDLQSRQTVLQREMVQRLGRTAALENHWLIYTLLGWEHLIACAVTYYLAEIVGVQRPFRQPYLVVWMYWAAAAWLTVHFVRRPARGEKNPLTAPIRRTWLMFFLLVGNVVGINLALRLPILVFLPVLATLGSFAFSIMTALVSRRFLPAGLLMFITSILIAQFPIYGFLIYGVSWLAVLQTLGIILWRSKRRLCPLGDPQVVLEDAHQRLEVTNLACNSKETNCPGHCATPYLTSADGLKLKPGSIKGLFFARFGHQNLVVSSYLSHQGPQIRSKTHV